MYIIWKGTHKNIDSDEMRLLLRNGTHKNIDSDEERLRGYFKARGEENMGLIYAVMWATAKLEERDAIEWIIRDVLPLYSPKAAKVAQAFLDGMGA